MPQKSTFSPGAITSGTVLACAAVSCCRVGLHGRVTGSPYSRFCRYEYKTEDRLRLLRRGARNSCARGLLRRANQIAEAESQVSRIAPAYLIRNLLEEFSGSPGVILHALRYPLSNLY